MAEADSTVALELPEKLKGEMTGILHEIESALFGLYELGQMIQEDCLSGRGITLGKSVQSLAQKAGVFSDRCLTLLGDSGFAEWFEIVVEGEHENA